MMRLWKPLVALALVGAMACGGSSSGSGNGDGLGTGGTGGDAGQDGGSGGTAGTDGTGGSGGIGGTGGIAEDIGELSIEITGLPEGVEAAVSVKGPGGFRAQLTESEVLTELEAGRYTITSEVVSNDDTPYFPSASSLQVDVEEGETAEVVITYQEGEFALVMPERVSLALSRSVDFEVEVRREEGFAVDVRAVGVLPEGLKLEHRRLSLGPDQERASFTLLNVANESEALLEEAVLLTFEAEIEEAELRVQATVEVEVLPWVTDAGDDGPGTIRELSAALTAMSAAPTLRFDPEVFSNGTTIPLDSPIVIDGSLAIEGIMVGEPPVPAVGMEANGSHPLFVIEGGDVRIARLSIRDGQAERGGCIQNFGNLVVEEVHLTDCHATDRGGAIANLTNDEGKVGSLEILGSLITENSADERAGGVYSEGNLLVQESEISRNTEAGIYLDNVSGAKGVTLRIQKSQITKNLSKNWGGGVFTEGELVGTITQSELSENEGERGGGALYTKEGGRWTIEGSVVSKNKGDGNGGGLSFAVGTVGATIRNTEIQGNQSGADGGGIFNYPSTSKLALENSVVSENKAYANGGGIYSNGPVEATTTTVEDNDAAAWSDEGGNGGGIYVSGEAAELDLVQSTVSNNSAYPGGGGVYSLGARATFTNSTIAGNYAAEGGGILISGEQALFLHSTVSNNQGGGIGIASAPGGKLFLSGTIVANNVAQQAPDIYNGRTPGDITTGGYNLIGVRNGSGVAEDDFDATDLFGTTAAKLDPKLEPLGDYGGPTPTMPPKADSPAIDKAGPCHSSIILAVKIDQRGETRPLGSACDIGAVEAH